MITVHLETSLITPKTEGPKLSRNPDSNPTSFPKTYCFLLGMERKPFMTLL